MDCDVTAQEFPLSAYCYISLHRSGEFQPLRIVFSEGYHYEYSDGQCGEMNGGEFRQVRWCRSEMVSADNSRVQIIKPLGSSA